MAKRPYPSKVNNEDSTSSAKKAKQSNAREAAALSLMALRHPNVELADSIMQNQQQQQQPNDTTSSNTLTNKAVRVIQTLGQHDCIPQALFRCQNKDPSAVFFVPIHHCTTNALSASSSVSGDQNDENNHEEQEASDTTTTSSNQQMPPLRMLSQSVSVLGLGRSTRSVTPATSTTTASHKRSWNKRQDQLLPVLLPPLLTHANGSCPLSPAPLLAPHLAKRAQPLWCTPEKQAEDSPQ